MFHSYEQIFRQRADAYQKAMELCPNARNREFELAVEPANIIAGETVCDAPAGGGYLRQFLPGDIEKYLAVETAPDFTSHCPLGVHDQVIQSPLKKIGLESDSVDACINMAGSHHLKDKTLFFQEARRILKPGGRLILADVEEGSASDHFLNGFVHENSSMGHEGLFISAATDKEIASCGFDISSSDVHQFSWAFSSNEEMGVFCKLLFGIDLAEEKAVTQAVEKILGFAQGPGAINMAWSLRYIVAVVK